MKCALWFLTLTGCLLISCDKKSGPTPVAATNNSGSLITAPVDYLNAVSKAQQHAVATIDTTSINQAIQMFYTDKGRYPRDLNELVTEQFIRKIPETPYGTKLVYDATSGSVKVVNQ